MPVRSYTTYRGRRYYDEDSLSRAKNFHACNNSRTISMLGQFFGAGSKATKEELALQMQRVPSTVTLMANKFVHGARIDIELAMVIGCMDYKTAHRLSSEFCKADFVRPFFQRGLITINCYPLGISINHKVMQEDLDWIRSLQPLKRERKKASAKNSEV